jgi:hypothetical protein
MTLSPPDIKSEAVFQQEKVEAKNDKSPEMTPLENKSQQENKGEAPEDPNWKAFREARKKDRADREAAERKALEKQAEVEALKAAMEAAFSKSSHHVEQQSYDRPEETEDERIEKKVQAALSIREAAAEKARIEREKQEYPNRLMKTYPDLNQVISQENLDYLDYHYPEISRPLQRLHDDFDKWSDIYNAIKKFVPNNTTAKKEAQKAEINMNKPKSISSHGITQPGEARSFSNMQDIEAKRAARYAEMKRIINGV